MRFHLIFVLRITVFVYSVNIKFVSFTVPVKNWFRWKIRILGIYSMNDSIFRNYSAKNKLQNVCLSWTSLCNMDCG